mmetsp:Transcript_30247/g.78561  ORF Transcript_30247/g.78561 Transcript_30247/m.78561 type:complete len:247 (+) Transcript_30247:170-910(+)
MSMGAEKQADSVRARGNHRQVRTCARTRSSCGHDMRGRAACLPTAHTLLSLSPATAAREADQPRGEGDLWSRRRTAHGALPRRLASARVVVVGAVGVAHLLPLGWQRRRTLRRRGRRRRGRLAESVQSDHLIASGGLRRRRRRRRPCLHGGGRWPLGGGHELLGGADTRRGHRPYAGRLGRLGVLNRLGDVLPERRQRLVVSDRPEHLCLGTRLGSTPLETGSIRQEGRAVGSHLGACRRLRLGRG